MLPVAEILPALFATLKQHNTVILSAPPGAGKSTYLPLCLLKQPEFAGKRLLMLEPRRLAARNIAAYLAAQLGEEVGHTVGYQIRHEQKTSRHTRLLIVTEGILTRKILQDPLLSDIDLLIFDEFHERSLQADLALALSLDVQQLRDDLQLLIMSATLDISALQQALQAPALTSEGRSYPVAVEYITPSAEPVWQQVARLALQATQRHNSSVLAFLPGQAEITQAAGWLQQQTLPDSLTVFPLLGSLSLTEQQQAIAPAAASCLKIVLATNLAETSLTIEGIHAVVDSGLCRRASFNPRQGITQLETAAISQAAAIQRAGRAGRLAPGICYRLDTQEKWLRRPQFEPPEIMLAELTSLRLDVAAWGCQVTDLQWLTAPPTAHLQVAEHLLQQLGALTTDGQLTAHGRAIQQLGTEPRLASMLLHSQSLEIAHRGAAWLACLLAVLLEEQTGKDDIYQQLQRLQQQGGRNKPLWRRAETFAARLPCHVMADLPLQLVPILLLRAWPDRLAKRRGQGYLLANGSGAALLPDHPLQQQEWLVALYLQQWQQQNRILQAVAINLPEILQDWQAELSWCHRSGWDESSASFQAEKQLCFGQLVLQRQPQIVQMDPSQKAQAWIEYIRNQGLSVLSWPVEAEQLRARLTLLAQYWPEDGWPDVSEITLLATLEHWLEPYLGIINNSQQLAKLPLYQAILAQLDYRQQQKLQQLAPTHWQAPTGSKLMVDYLAEAGPLLSVRIQEMYGQLHTPLILDGRIPLTIALLSPSRQPLQLTKDLASFWSNTWAEVKKEMKGRYPKHFWPDDPAHAAPTTKTKKAMQR